MIVAEYVIGRGFVSFSIPVDLPRIKLYKFAVFFIL